MTSKFGTFQHHGDKGFTLIEILTVIGLISMIAGFALSTNIGSLRAFSFRDDRDELVSVLQKARSEAMNGICLGGCTGGASHGVHLESGKYVLFQGGSYAARDTETDEIHTLSGATALSGATDVVFERLSGDAVLSPAGSAIMVQSSDGHASTIKINAEGQITWTN
jgi:prepilin-type N-terminal cleavage/methylation domain-containing protein